VFRAGVWQGYEDKRKERSHRAYIPRFSWTFRCSGCGASQGQVVGTFRDSQEIENLALKLGEFGVEDLKSLSVAVKDVPLREGEEP
jgi:hypothetical protein